MNTHDLSIIVGSSFRQKSIESVRVVMSWSHAKALQKVLADQIEMHEKLFGEINFEPNKETLDRFVAEGKVNIQSLEQK